MLPIGIGILTAACFLPALFGSFLNWDDNVNFLDNPAYRGLGGAQIRWAFTSVLFGHYIPLTRLSWSLNYVLGGMDPWGYHLTNLALHGLNAALFYFVARRLLAAAAGAGSQLGRRGLDLSAAAAVAALIFGLHPLRVEPVAWITARADLLCATFSFLAIYAYLRAVEGDGPAHRGRLIASAAALVAALLSKGVALPLVAGLLLLDVYPLRRLSRWGWWALIREKIPLLIATLGGSLVVGWALRVGAVLNEGSQYGLVARLAVAAHSFLMSAARFIWPGSLSPLYEMPARIGPLEPRFALALAAAVTITVALIALRRWWPAGLAAWTFSILMLAPTSAAIRQGADLSPDRYSYLAGLGFPLLIGGAALGVIRLVRQGTLARPVGWVVALAGLVAVAELGLTSWTSSQIWQDSETLWRWAIEVDPDCSVCHGKLGESVLGGPGGVARVTEAEALFRRAISLRPDLPDAYSNLGTALVIQGRYPEAEAFLRGFMERAPHSTSGPERLGLIYLLQGRYDPATPLLRQAFRRRPDAPGLRTYLAQALEGQARIMQAQGRHHEAEALRIEAHTLDAAAPEGARERHPSPRP